MAAAEPVFWHGGQRGLARGSILLPPIASGARNTIADYAERMRGEPWDREHVYLTTDFSAALAYAVMHPSSGWVYRCEPIGAVEDDPDCATAGLSYRCERARILEIRIPKKWQVRDVRRAFDAMVCGEKGGGYG